MAGPRQVWEDSSLDGAHASYVRSAGQGWKCGWRKNCGAVQCWAKQFVFTFLGKGKLFLEYAIWIYQLSRKNKTIENLHSLPLDEFIPSLWKSYHVAGILIRALHKEPTSYKTAYTNTSYANWMRQWLWQSPHSSSSCDWGAHSAYQSWEGRAAVLANIPPVLREVPIPVWRVGPGNLFN